jgi:SAM-dependent methyltransferase
VIDVTERQVANRLEDIRADHRERYEWAAKRLAGKRVVDAACGVGYGSTILAGAECSVLAFDKDAKTIEYAKQNWNHNPHITYTQADLYEVEGSNANADAVICFEALEHLVHPETALWNFRNLSDTLICSVPNEVGFPFRGYRHHHRHWSPDEFTELLRSNGWRVDELFGQEDAVSPVKPNVLDGRTLIAVCSRDDSWEMSDDGQMTPERILGGPVPNSVAIVAMGKSRETYIYDTIQRWGGKVADEIWAINAIGGLIQWDRLFHQDDIAIQTARAKAGHEGVGHMLDWMKKSTRPIYTSRAYPDYPATVEYPLEWVLNRCGTLYHTSTVAYALTLAIACGVKEIKLYGCDFSYPNLHKREKGRANLEFWLGVAASRGIKVTVPDSSTLLDADQPVRDRAYGYDTEWVSVDQVGGRFRVSRVDRLPEDIPSASQVELRYSHVPEKEALATQDKED